MEGRGHWAESRSPGPSVEREWLTDADVERAAPREGDSGEVETLPDGSISVPVLEEQLVVEKRMVVRERIIIRKRTVSEEHRVQAELRKERVEVEADPGVELQED